MSQGNTSFGDSSSSGNPREAAVFQSMTLLATLQTAFDVWEGVSRRRSGSDPSAQEPSSVVRPELLEACRELRRLHHQLVTSRVCSGSRYSEHPLQDLAVPVQRFDELVKLQRVSRLLQATHQRLMSLYPDVSEELVEQARRLQSASESFQEIDDDRYREHISPFLDELSRFVRRTAGALRRSR